jgi:hypothetical protein
MVFGNLSAAIWVFGLLYIPIAAIDLIPSPVDRWRDGVWLLILAYLAALVVSYLLFFWSAVAWHRYILLGERTHALIPPFRRDRWAAYLRAVLRLGLIFVVMLLVTLFIILIVAPLLSPATIELATYSLVFVVLVVSSRLAPVLPASAVGRDLSIREAWRDTRGATGAIAVATILFMIVATVLDRIGVLLLAPPLDTVWLTITDWIATVVGIAILTTIYGHYVEGRPIN